jgi:hypothetical protein
MKYVVIFYDQAYYQTEVEAKDKVDAESKAWQKWNDGNCDIIDSEAEVVEVKEEER